MRTSDNETLIAAVAPACSEILRLGIDEGVFEPGDPVLLVKMMTAVYQVQLADWLEREGTIPADTLVERIQATVRRLLCRTPTD